MCKILAKKAQDIIEKKGCLLASMEIDALCESEFGPVGGIPDTCAAAFDAVCPTFLSWIEKKIYNPLKVCKLLRMC